mmetsp:Transcript_40913/g.104264  ORF Transcript_40913/g.104264 Transcript_40913/m.104264 type:complete len:213 (-) Transcript_40913:55-693(-)
MGRWMSTWRKTSPLSTSLGRRCRGAPSSVSTGPSLSTFRRTFRGGTWTPSSGSTASSPSTGGSAMPPAAPASPSTTASPSPAPGASSAPLAWAWNWMWARTARWTKAAWTGGTTLQWCCPPGSNARAPSARCRARTAAPAWRRARRWGSTPCGPPRSPRRSAAGRLGSTPRAAASRSLSRQAGPDDRCDIAAHGCSGGWVRVVARSCACLAV